MKQDKHYTFIKNNNDYMKIKKATGIDRFMFQKFW